MRGRESKNKIKKTAIALDLLETQEEFAVMLAATMKYDHDLMVFCSLYRKKNKKKYPLHSRL